MRRILAVLLFLGIVTLIYGGMHLYLHGRLSEGLGLSVEASRYVLAPLLFTLAASLFLAHALQPRAPRLYRAVWWTATVWMGLAFYLFVFLLAGQALQALAGAAGLEWARRPLAESAFALPAGGLAAAMCAWAYARARARPRATHLQVPVAHLPPALDGLVIVHISDVHVGAIVDAGRLARIVEWVHAENPDLVVITGDLVDEPAPLLEPLVPILARLHAPLGTYAVLGNHEVFAGIAGASRFIERAGIRLLRDEAVEPAPGLRLVGFDDPIVEQHEHQRLGNRKAAFARVLAEQPPDAAVVVLYHRPDHLGTFEKLGADLVLSGHTHAGQMWPFSYVSKLRHRHHAGLYRAGRTRLYVSRGIGTWGPPMRVGSPPELVRITLRRGDPAEARAALGPRPTQSTRNPQRTHTPVAPETA